MPVEVVLLGEFGASLEAVVEFEIDGFEGEGGEGLGDGVSGVEERGVVLVGADAEGCCPVGEAIARGIVCRSLEVMAEAEGATLPVFGFVREFGYGVLPWGRGVGGDFQGDAHAFGDGAEGFEAAFPFRGRVEVVVGVEERGCPAFGEQSLDAGTGARPATGVEEDFFHERDFNHRGHRGHGECNLRFFISAFCIVNSAFISLCPLWLFNFKFDA